MRSTPYKVGYAKPPRSGQFRKGQSGNPRGRPPKPPETFSSVIRVAFDRKIEVNEGCKIRYLHIGTVLGKILIAEAKTGDTQATAMIMKWRKANFSNKLTEILHVELVDYSQCRSELYMRRPKGETKPKPKLKRKSGSVSRYRSIEDLLDDTEVVNLFGRKKRMSQREQIVWRHIMKALNGELASLNMLLKLAKEEPEDRSVPKMVVNYVPYREPRLANDK
jgi:hypothetical protein